VRQISCSSDKSLWSLRCKSAIWWYSTGTTHVYFRGSEWKTASLSQDFRDFRSTLSCSRPKWGQYASSSVHKICRSSTFQSPAMGSLLGKDLGAFFLQDRTLGCWGVYKPGKAMLANHAMSSWVLGASLAFPSSAASFDLQNAFSICALPSSSRNYRTKF
jgi:hypothetical protein